ncbi:hypothetical protein SpiGrapes_2375 [Sphaerochaeta pleomorpha str. Grapes]|uniref:Uncharacterized protein n=1 Tax=Sphaerochaeta pleomorpha (strain ATCC BAA-1885 / DSM 22778 / Grapes) TaxID=158190 RepID=G8QSW5_SPHPG|nr:hypothetical protein [Sphaerochaeta pleomorpha]AEV30147.1 hypothetical protein SpiGrapes_2375 [Sphaerochaeta pleomorpha str. Grapes]
MSYQEKRTLTNMFSGIAVLVAYYLYAFGKYQRGLVEASDLKFWAGTMLIFIGIGVVASILIMILFHILYAIALAVKQGNCDEKKINQTLESSMVEDEMDKLIELKSLRIGFLFAGIGFVGALVSLMFEQPPMVMLNLLFFSFSVGSLFEGGLSLYYYRKGL